MEVPDFVREKIAEISQAKGYDPRELLEEYIKILNDDNIANIVFDDPAERFEMALGILLSHVLDSTPAFDFNVIPVGISNVRDTSKGLMRRLYCIIVEENTLRLESVGIFEDFFSKLRDIQFFNLYRVKLGKLSDGSLIFVNKTRFNSCEPVLEQFNRNAVYELLSRVGVVRVPKIPDAPKYPSKMRKTSDGREVIDDTDWRVIKGDVLRTWKLKNNPNTVGCSIYDMHTPLEDRVLPDGRVISPGMTVWLPADKFVDDLRPGVIADFYGTITVNEHGIASMNCFLVVPAVRFGGD